ncbi:MAG: hypothetical protein AAGC91_14195 [Pseudomonadota bacterium]
MTDSWMEHPNLVVWFDDIEDAVTTAFALKDEQRSQVKALRASRANTWVMMAKDADTRDALRARLSEAQHYVSVPVARDCLVLVWRDDFIDEEDAFEKENGFGSIEVDYVEEGSPEDIRLELMSDAEDYAASEEAGWFYAINDGEFEADDEVRDPSCMRGPTTTFDDL